MKTVKASVILVVVLMLSALFAACGSEPPTTTGNDTSKTDQYYVGVGNATVNGETKKVLTDNRGWTLYYFTDDTATESKCSGACATTWPPYVYEGEGTPSYSKEIPGKLTVYKTTHGNQLYYNGHLLYKYNGDSGAGQANGEGVGGKWYVATPDTK